MMSQLRPCFHAVLHGERHTGHCDSDDMQSLFNALMIQMHISDGLETHASLHKTKSDMYKEFWHSLHDFGLFALLVLTFCDHH